MGYFGTPASGGSGHTHTNLAVLNAITSAGGGQIITPAERSAIGGFTPPAGHGSEDWGPDVPSSSDQAIARLAAALKDHLGALVPPLTQQGG